MNIANRPSDMSRLSVACVVDGSFAFAEHWTAVINYISPLLQYIAAQASASSGSQASKSVPEILQSCQIATIVYGSESGRRTSPLLSRQHFVNPQVAFRQLKEECELGIGSSSSANSRGMATLEAMVCALEVGRQFGQFGSDFLIFM
jgi:hypothetical protein